MAISIPVVGHLRVLSLVADLRDEIPGCSKYIPKEQALTGNTIRSFPASAVQSLGFKPSLPSSANLAQIEVLLRHSKVLGWRWTDQLRLQVVLSSCVLLDITLNENGVDIGGAVVDQTLSACVRKRTPVCCAISDQLVVIGFSNSELLSYRPGGLKDGSAICHHKRRSKEYNNVEMQMVFSPDCEHMLLCFSPVKPPGASRQWFPKKPEEMTWMSQVYRCNPNDDVPLKRLHRYQGRSRAKVLQLTFLPNQTSSFLILDHLEGPDASIGVFHYVMNGRSLSLISFVSMDTLGTVLSSAVHARSEMVAVGLEDYSVAVFDVRRNVLRRKICDTRPEQIRWDPNGHLLAVMSSEGSLQILDLALQSIPISLLGDEDKNCSKLRLRTCFNSVTPLATFDWVHLLPTKSPPSSGYLISALVLLFERGPLSMLCLKGEPDTLQLPLLTEFRLQNGQYVEMVRLFRALDFVDNASDISSGIRFLLNAVLQRFPNGAERLTVIIHDALALLQEETSSESGTFEEEFYVLARRTFAYLLRNKHLEEALWVAKQLEDERYYKQIQRAAMRTNNHVMIKAAEKEIKEFAAAEKELNELLETDSDQPHYMTLYPSVVVPSAPCMTPSPKPFRPPTPSARSPSRLSTLSTRSERHITTFSWTDMGTV